LPLPRNWAEELAAEYLELEGCLVETGHPFQIEGSGRREIDVLGFKVKKGQLTVIHIELGVPLSLKDLKETVEWKFDSVAKKEIKRLVRRFFFGFQNFTYSPWYISVWERGTGKKWKKLKDEKHCDGIELMTFKDLMGKIESAVKEWKRKNKTPKGGEPTLPENLWLLKMLEMIKK